MNYTPHSAELVQLKTSYFALSYRDLSFGIPLVGHQPFYHEFGQISLKRLSWGRETVQTIYVSSECPGTLPEEDVKDLSLTTNPAFKSGAETGDGYIDRQTSQYICPTTGVEMNGKFKFCYVWKCGCVVSERALKQVKDNICHKCQTPYSEDDIIILNPEDADLESMTLKMYSRLAKIKAEKRNKKTQKSNATEITACSSTSHSQLTVEHSEATTNGDIKLENRETVEKTNDKDLKTKQNEPSNSKRKNKILPAGDRNIDDPAFKKAKSTYSVAKDGNASTVYKSLFTSSDKAKTQTRAHWITYNPFYN